MKKITNLLMVVCLALFSWQGHAQNGGDDCASAVAVTPGTFSQTQINDASGGTNGGDSAWFVYTATADGTINVNSCLGGQDTRLFIFDSCGGAQLANNDDSCPFATDGSGSSFASEIDELAVVTGQQYLIQWDDRWDEGPFDWSLTFTPLPDCLEVSGLTETNVNETETNVTFTDTNATAPVGGWDYELLDLTAGETAGNGITGNVTTETINLTGLTGGGNQYSISVIADCDGAGTESAPVILTWFQGTVPGISCDDAIVAVEGTNTAVFVDASPGTNNGDSVWFTYTPTEDGNLTVSSCATGGVDTRVFLYDGDCATLNQIVTIDDSCGLSSDFTEAVVANTEYFIQWDDRWSTATFDWQLTFTPVQTEVPGCASNFFPADDAVDVTTNVTFTFDAPTTGGIADSYDIFLGTDAAALNNIGNVPGTSVNITGLLLGTEYFWQVVPINAVGPAVGCVVNSFTTVAPPSGPQGVTCGAGNQATSQFTETFDAQGGWTGDISATTNNAGFWFIGQSGTTVSGNTGPNDAEDVGGSYMYYESSGGTTTLASAVSPAIDLSAIDAAEEAELSFNLYAYGTGIATLNVGASTSAAGPFTNVFTWTGQIQTAGNQAWLEVGADISAFTGGDVYIEFSYAGINDFTGDIAIDTMEVIACEAIPACQVPDTLAVSGVTGGDATITFNDPNDPDVNNYTYELTDVTAGTAPTTANANSTSISLTGLTADSDYEIRILANCPTGGLGGTVPSEYSSVLAWTQTEAPGCASNPSPLDGATDTPIGTVTFTWDAPTTGGTATEYDVYGGDTAALEFGVIATVTTNTVDLSVNAPLTTLFWQVVPKNAGGEATGCDVWSFTTVAADPSGADCASAEPVTEGSYTVFLEDATPGNNNGDSVWFVYTATNFGTINVNSCLGGSDTRLFIFDECDGSLLASNDDSCAFNPDGTGSTFASEVDGLAVVPGEDYYIQFDDRWSTGVFTWNITLTAECPDSTTWDGTAWSNGTPDGTKTAIIDGAYTTTTADIDACAIYISPTGTLTVEADTFVSANGTIQNDGIMTVNHTGSVVQVDDTASMTNNGTLEVSIDSPTSDLRDFIISGSPLDGETREDVWGASYNVQSYTSANFVPFDFGTSQPNVVYNFTDDNLDDWNPHTGALTPGAGYLVFPQDAYGDAGTSIPNFTHSVGNLNNGVITQPLNFNTAQLDSPNMLSNPYASAIDTDSFLAANAEIDAVYFWEHGAAPDVAVPGVNTANYTMEDISAYNGTGGIPAASGAGTTPTAVMASSQGFGVFASAAGTATFNNAMRVTSGNTTLRATDTNRDRIWLHIANEEFQRGGNTLIGFMDNATQGFDQGFDNYRIGTIVSLYSHFDATSEDGYSIQGRESFDADMQISLGFATLIEAETAYKVSIDNFEGANLENVDVYLVDHALNVTTNLSKTDYSFTSNAGEYNNRFTLQFVDRSVLGTTNASLEAISISPNPAQDFVMIVSPVAQVTGITITDIQGRIVDTVNVEGLNTYQLDMSRLGSAVYLITVNTPSGDITKRIIKK